MEKICKWVPTLKSEYALCTMRSHGTEQIKLGRKSSKTKEARTSPTRLSFVLKVPLRNLRPSVIYSVPCDRIVQRAYFFLLIVAVYVGYFSVVGVAKFLPLGYKTIYGLTCSRLQQRVRRQK